MRFFSFSLVFYIASVAVFTHSTKAAKVLAVYCYPWKSHFIMHGAMIRTLLEQGHHVTAVVAISLLPMKLGDNYTEILIDPPYDLWNDFKSKQAVKDSFDLLNMTPLDILKITPYVGFRSTEHAIKNAYVQKIINPKKTDGVFDIMIAAEFYQEAFLLVANKYNIPVVTVSNLGALTYMSQLTGIVSPWSFVPSGLSQFTDRMSFFERLMNSFYVLYEDLSRGLLYEPAMDDLVDKHIHNLPKDRPSVKEMTRNISIFFLNSFTPLRTPRPYANNMIDIGGVHIDPVKPLPQDIQEFLDRADHGAIYFSLGTNVQSKDMPKKTLEIFISVFAKMKQRILWKFEDDRLTNLPSNIKVGKWMPQNDILAHSNVKVFLTHGGLYGSQESVYHAVPMLGIPFFSDQYMNIRKAVHHGYALTIRFHSITAENLHQSLTELLENPKYQKNVQEASRIFRDRSMSARETFVYWFEYVLRHKGTKHLRSTGVDLNIFQFYLLDIFGFVLLVLLTLIFSFIWLVRSIYKRSFKSEKILHKKKD